MKKIIDYFRKNWPLILLATIATLLIMFKLNQKGQPEEPSVIPLTPEKEILPEPQSKFSQFLSGQITHNILFSQEAFTNFPSTLPVYKTQKFTTEEVLSRLAEIVVDLGFLGSPETEKRDGESYLIWHEENNYLEINASSGQFTFAGKTQLGEAGQKYDSKEIQTLIKQKLIFWKLIGEEALIKKTTGFGVAGLELVPVENLEQASVLQLFFESKFDTYPLVGLGPAENHIEVKIETNGVLLSLFFNLHQSKKEALDDYPLKSFNEVIDSLREGKSQIIQVLSSSQEERSFPPESEIEEINLSSISIAYYETVEAQDLFQPVFLLEGKMTLHDGREYQIHLILPAISSQYLEEPKEHFQL